MFKRVNSNSREGIFTRGRIKSDFKKVIYLLLLSFALLHSLVSLASGPWYCGDNGYTYSNQSFCNTFCTHECEQLQTISYGSTGTCDTDKYEGFVYNPNTQYTYAISKETGFWSKFKSKLSIIKCAETNELLKSIMSFFSVSNAWIGAFDPGMSTDFNIINPNRFIWRNNSSITYSNWSEGEPNNKLFAQDEGIIPASLYGEHWVEMNDNGTWSDTGYHYTNSSVQDYAPYLPALVQWYGKLSCVNGMPYDNTTENQIVNNISQQYCDGSSTCYICSDNTSCSNGGQCPSGYEYNSQMGNCQAPATCPSGGTASNDTCYASVKYNCPQNYTYNKQNGDCESMPSIVCPSGSSYNASSKNCEVSANNGSCPNGFLLSEDRNECYTNPSYQCPSGGSWNGMVCSCSASKTCPAGYELVDGICTAQPTCPNDDYTGIENGRCITDPEPCSPGPSTLKECVHTDNGYFCPLGAVKCNNVNNDLTPTCPDNGTLNTNLHECTAQPNITCPSGYTYDRSIDKCTVPAECPDNGSLNPDTDKCEIVVTSSMCPTGYTYNATYDACVKTPTCPSGGTYNPSRDRCEYQVSKSCPGEYSYDNSSDECISSPQCPEGTDYNKTYNECLVSANLTCPDNYTQNGDECISSPQCPDNSSYSSDYNECIETASVNCPDGYALKGSECIANPLCPSGSSYDNSSDECVESAGNTCPSGFSYSSADDKCEADPQCPEGSNYSSSYDECVEYANNTCPTGYTLSDDNSTCYTSPQCPTGSDYDANYNECVESSSPVCPSGYTYNSSDGACEVAPLCPTGSSYNSDTDRCEKQAENEINPEGAYSYVNMWGLVYLTGELYMGSSDNWVSLNGSGQSEGWTGDGIQLSNGSIRQYATDSSNNVHYGSWIPIWGSGTSSVTISLWGSTETYGIQTSNGNIRSFTNSTYRDWISLNSGGVTQNLAVINGKISYGYFGTGVSIYGSGSSDLYGMGFDISNGQIRIKVMDSNYNYKYGGWIPIWGSGTSSATNGYGDNDSIQTSNGEIRFGMNGSWGQWIQLKVPSCPSGWTLSGSICYQPASCPDNGTLNTTTDECEIQPSHSCPNGFTYDSSLNECVAVAACPGGGSLDTNTDRCVIGIINSCPDGFSYDNSSGYCTAPASCPDGSSLDSSLDKCVTSSSPTCPNGFTYDSSLNECVASATCPTGGSLNTSSNQCEAVPSYYCPSGFTYDNNTGYCTTSALCPTGGSLNTTTDECEASLQANCPSGTTYDSSINYCTAPASCPDNGTLNTTKDECQVSVTNICPSDYTFDNSTNLCYSSPICDYGYYDSSIDLCRLSASDICPSDYTFDNSTDKCLKDPQCQSPGQYSDTIDECGATPDYNCPSNYYNADDKLCEADPQCDNGTFDNSTNQCEYTTFSCPFGSQYKCYNYNGDRYCSRNSCVKIDNTSKPISILDDNTTRDKQADGSTTSSGCEGTVYIFNGETYRCRKAGIETGGTSCCRKSKDWFGLGRCKPSEVKLAKLRAAGVCHYVGTYCAIKVLGICLQKKESFCCFHSVLGRIVQEQSRKTQDIPYNGWGGAKDPVCWGYTPDQFQEIDWSKINLSEYYTYIENKVIPRASSTANNAVKRATQKLKDNFQQMFSQ